LIAEVTFFNAARFGIYVYRVIRAFLVALIAADAAFTVKKDDAVQSLVQGAFFAVFDAGCIIAMVADAGQKELADMRIAS